MRALVIQHDHVSPPGPIADRLEERLVEVVCHEVVPAERHDDPTVTTEFPEVTDFDLVIPMGAPWAAYDLERVGGWVLPEIELLRRADEARIPVLGICFGGQLLAMAHGGEVGRSPYPEIGWVEIETDIPALVPRGPWFHWHYDRWTLPPGAREVARNEAASQAFTLRRNLAVQFHPELTTAMLHGWLENGGAHDAVTAGRDPEALLAQTRLEEPAARARAAALIDAFLDTL